MTPDQRCRELADARDAYLADTSSRCSPSPWVIGRLRPVRVASAVLTAVARYEVAQSADVDARDPIDRVAGLMQGHRGMGIGHVRKNTGFRLDRATTWITA